MLGWLVLSVLLLSNNNLQSVSGCRSRSGEDSDRDKVYSHQGTEPNWDKDAPVKGSEAGEKDGDGGDDENRAREDGEIKVKQDRAFRVKLNKKRYIEVSNAILVLLVILKRELKLFLLRLERSGSFQLLKLKLECCGVQ